MTRTTPPPDSTQSSLWPRARPNLLGAAARLAALALFAVVVVRAAWLSDDAYISFRVVENAIGGLGLTWNPAERVQAYTHPLWLFALIGGRLLTGELYYTTIWLSITLSAGVAWLLAFRAPVGPAAAVFGLLILTFSKAFIDFSTSGLENPLAHLLLTLFCLEYLVGEANDRRVFVLALLAGLLALNRTDTLLLVLPALVWAVWRQRTPRALALAAAGFLPFLLWTAFSLFYYGFPFPNTAYAKIGTGIATADLARQGLAYLRNSLRWDPLTLTVIGAGVLAGVAQGARPDISGAPRACAAGIVLYLVYVVRIGGDFMSGRFLAAPLLVAVILLMIAGDRWLRRPGVTAVSLAAVALLGFQAHFPTVLSDGRYGALPQHEAWRDDDIADERVYYYPFTGLLNPARQLHPWAEQGQVLRAQGPAVVEHGNVGFLGYFAGPDVHIIDRNGLTDPLLARLPVRDPAEWRVGHYRRNVPDGYADTLRAGRNVIADAGLAQFHDALSIAIRAPLFDPRRPAEIWRLNLGCYGHLLPGH